MRRFENRTRLGLMQKSIVCLSMMLSSLVISHAQDTIKYVFAETFENIPDLRQSTILKAWQIHQSNYKEGSQSIIDLGGNHGKVWHAVYHKGLAAGYGDDGFAIDIPVGNEFDELWFESDLYADPEFDPYSVTGKYSGKMLFGFTGGNEYLHNGSWKLDSSANGNGWTAQGVWGSNYALRPYYYDQLADGQTHQMNANLTIPRGYWIHITRRVKMNTPGKKDGIYEVYINDSLRAQATDVEWRSWQQGKDYGKISHLHLTYFFGGGGADYASRRDNYIRIDNMVAYYYTPTAKGYLKGAAPKGHKISRIVPQKDIYPSKLLFDEVFTNPRGRIKSHYNCGVFSPTSMEIITKKIVRPEGPIKLTFNSFNAGVDNYPTLNSYTKVYAGEGSSKTLIYKFDRSNQPNGTYTINSSIVTIEYFAGLSESKGFSLDYTSPGDISETEPDDTTPPVTDNPDNDTTTVPDNTNTDNVTDTDNDNDSDSDTTGNNPDPVVDNEPDNPQEIENLSPQMDNQEFIVYQSQFKNNIIGKVMAYDLDQDQELTYSIVSGNPGELFSIDAQSGELKVTSEGVFLTELSVYDLIIRVSDNADEPESTTAEVGVTFLANTNKIYINPENSNDPIQNGSVMHPYDSWNDVTWKDGNLYLQKRGTTAVVDRIVIGANNVIMGAYGEGDLPVISSETQNYILNGFEKSNITIKNLHFKGTNATSCIYFLGGNSNSIVVEYCTFEGSMNAIRIIDGKKFTARYNTIAVDNDGIYSTALENEIFYNVFKKNNVSINITSNLSKVEIFNNVFYDNMESVSSSYSELVLYNNIFYLTSSNQYAIKHASDRIMADYNIYYPEQVGFVMINGEAYSKLNNVKELLKIDLHSFNSDPKFRDIYQHNFNLEAVSPAINRGIDLNLERDFNGEMVPFSGVPDIGISEFTGVTALPDAEEDLASQVTIFPNPSTGIVNISMEMPEDNNNEQPSLIKVIDMGGKHLFTRSIEGTNGHVETTVDLSEKANGLYYIILQMADKTIANKLILQR